MAMRLDKIHLAALALLAGAAGALPACEVPLSSSDQTCVSYCTLLQNCAVSGAPQAECNAWCNAFGAEVDHTGCKPQFEDATTCVVMENTCQAAACGALIQAFTDCTSQFCKGNPTDTVCPSS
jgi:hypothetical protein